MVMDVCMVIDWLTSKQRYSNTYTPSCLQCQAGAKPRLHAQRCKDHVFQSYCVVSSYRAVSAPSQNLSVAFAIVAVFTSAEDTAERQREVALLLLTCYDQTAVTAVCSATAVQHSVPSLLPFVLLSCQLHNTHTQHHAFSLTLFCWKSERWALQLLSNKILDERSS